MIPQVLSDAESRMKKAVEVLKRELAAYRTGRATPALVENIPIDYYGVPTPLKELASITVPEARVILIQPWDKRALANVEKGLLKSDLGLNPVNDGNVIRLTIPPLSLERRKELVRLVRKRVEEARVAVRNVRRDAMERVRAMEKNKELSQDESHRAQERLQKLTDSFIEQIGEICKEKEAEVMEA